jgi:hypothetical protein
MARRRCKKMTPPPYYYIQATSGDLVGWLAGSKRTTTIHPELEEGGQRVGKFFIFFKNCNCLSADSAAPPISPSAVAAGIDGHICCVLLIEFSFDPLFFW